METFWSLLLAFDDRFDDRFDFDIVTLYSHTLSSSSCRVAGMAHWMHLISRDEPSGENLPVRSRCDMQSKARLCVICLKRVPDLRPEHSTSVKCS